MVTQERDPDHSSSKPTELNETAISSNETVTKMRKLIEARTLKGFRDLLPAEAIAKGSMLQALRNVFDSYGYVPIETPHLEYTEVLVGDAGDDIQKQLYRFRDNGDRDVTLRFDLTVPFARYSVQHASHLPLPFKRYAIGEVFRGEKSQHGRYREFTQCDFDFIGTTSIASDAEIVLVIAASMRAISVDSFTISINNRKVMNGLSNHLGAADKAVDILRIIDKISNIGTEGAKKELIAVGLPESSATTVLEFISLSNSYQSTALFEKLSPYADQDETLAEGVKELKGLIGILEQSGLDSSCYKIDLSTARGLGYYTGTVYETLLDDLPQLGSV
ncbi:MAG: HisS family protein [Bdellovibrionota bacterium]